MDVVSSSLQSCTLTDVPKGTFNLTLVILIHFESIFCTK